MRHRACAVVLSLTAASIAAVPVSAQLWFFPDFALPSGSATPSTWVAGTYGRGLNDASGKVDAVGGSVGRTTERGSFMASFGRITEDEGEYTVGGAVSVDLNTGEGARLSLQGGIGWMDVDLLGETLTALRFPIGMAVRGTVQSGAATMTPWVMPRVNISRASGFGESTTETDFGASGGVSFTTESGFGLHTALDALFSEGETLWLLGVGLHFSLGGNR